MKYDAADSTELPDQSFTDVDLRSTRRDVTEDFRPDRLTNESDNETNADDAKSLRESDTTVPEV